MLKQRPGDGHDEKWKGDEQRPTDDLPAAHCFGKLSANCIADCSGDDGAEQGEVGPLQGALRKKRRRLLRSQAVAGR